MKTRLPGCNSYTFPRGFLDFLRLSQARHHRIGDYEPAPSRLGRFNRALRELSPGTSPLTMDQIANAAQRVLARYDECSTPPFVVSRMAALERLESMAADADWGASEGLQHTVEVLQGYREDNDDLIPDALPVVGLLDDAVLVDVALQMLRGELADYEDFCRFRRMAAEFAGLSQDCIGFTRAHWLATIVQTRASIGRIESDEQEHHADDARASLFHII